MHFRTFLLVAVSALGLTHCNKAPVAATDGSAPGVVLVTEGVSPHFQKVTSHLELGGASFSYAEEGEIFTLLGKMMDEVVKSMPEKEKAKMPAGFSFKKVFGLIGLDAIKASGLSSRKTAEGFNHQRSFVYIPEGRKGLLTLSGGPAEPLLVSTLAAKGTDLAIEFPLHLKDWTAQAWPVITELAPPEERAMFEAMASAPQPPLGISYKEMAEKLSVRIALLATFMPEQSIAAPGAPVSFPGVNAAIVIDKLGWLKDALKQQVLPMVQQPGAPMEVTTVNGVTTVRFNSPMGPPPMDFQPAFQLDEAADRLIIATRPGYLDVLVGSGDRLKNEPEFAAVWKGMPTDANGCLFVSKRFMATLIKGVKEGVSAKGGADDTATVMSVLDLVAKHASSAQAVAYANLPDGILSVSNTTLPAASPTSISSITTLAVLSSLGASAFTSVQQTANQGKLFSQGREVLTAIKAHAAKNDGKYPAELGELVISNSLDNPDILSVSENGGLGGDASWLYDATLTLESPGISIVLASPFTTKGPGGKISRVVIRNDGRAETITEEDFQRTKDFNLQ